MEKQYRQCGDCDKFFYEDACGRGICAIDDTPKHCDDECNIESARIMKLSDYIRLCAQIAILKEIAIEYKGESIDNIIQQMEANKKEAEK